MTFNDVTKSLASCWIPFSVSYNGKPDEENSPDNFVIHITDSLNNFQLKVAANLGFAQLKNGEFVLFSTMMEG